MFKQLTLTALTLLTLAPFAFAKESVPQNPVVLSEVRLLDKQELFDRNLPPQALENFTRIVEESVRQSASVSPWDFVLLVQATLSKNSPPSFELVHQGGAMEAILQAIHKGLRRIPDLRTKSDTVKIQFHFKINKIETR